MEHPLTEISKFLSYVLRHTPEAIGLDLDGEGWAHIDALIACAKSAGRELDPATIGMVVASDDKQRFAISGDGLRIRAVQGHSTRAVAIRREASAPPDVLYHGTAVRFLDSILTRGLVSGQRHHVHLSQDVEVAASVGKRYGQPAVLHVDAARMHHEGYAFFMAENGVWLVDHVPAEYLALPAGQV